MELWGIGGVELWGWGALEVSSCGAVGLCSCEDCTWAVGCLGCEAWDERQKWGNADGQSESETHKGGEKYGGVACGAVGLWVCGSVGLWVCEAWVRRRK